MHTHTHLYTHDTEHTHNCAHVRRHTALHTQIRAHTPAHTSRAPCPGPGAETGASGLPDRAKKACSERHTEAGEPVSGPVGEEMFISERFPAHLRAHTRMCTQTHTQRVVLPRMPSQAGASTRSSRATASRSRTCATIHWGRVLKGNFLPHLKGKSGSVWAKPEPGAGAGSDQGKPEGCNDAGRPRFCGAGPGLSPPPSPAPTV